MKVDMPLVSIVIPVYNAASYVREAIDSVLNQSYPNIELIVLDDGSTDNTREVLKSYPSGLFYWESHFNMGQSATLNKGWNMAKGDIISYLSADDALCPEAAFFSVEALQQNQDVIMTYCDYTLINDKSENIRQVNAPNFNYKKMVSDLVVQPGPAPFFRKALFVKIGGWNPIYRQVPDLEYWLRLGLEGDFLRIPKVLAKFRVHDESQTYMEASVGKSEECLQVIEEYFNMPNFPDAIRALESRSKASAHLFVARMHLRAGRYYQMVNHLRRMVEVNPKSIFSSRAVKMLINGILFRMKLKFF